MLNHYVIYKHPSDYPNNYVVRAWRLVYGIGIVPDKDCQLAETLEDARKLIPSELCQFDRVEEDEPCVVEVWM